MSYEHEKAFEKGHSFDQLAGLMLPHPEMISRMMQPTLSVNAAWLDLNARLFHDAAETSKEWLDFIGRRLEQDAEFAASVRMARTPQQFFDAWSRFFQRAARDYRDELSEMGRLSTKAASDATRAVETVTESMTSVTNSRSHH
jgi:Phasin protein